LIDKLQIFAGISVIQDILHGGCTVGFCVCVCMCVCVCVCVFARARKIDVKMKNRRKGNVTSW